MSLLPPDQMAILEGITGKACNPYTEEEEATWQAIAGPTGQPATDEQIRVFEFLTGKKFDHNYLY